MKKIQGKKDRNDRVLSHIINIYISTAVPVSSKAVAMFMGGEVSSATIRNIMSDLEKEGMIEQPHTSAGRRPTDKGYRYYVEIVKERQVLEKALLKRMEKHFEDRIRCIQDVIDNTAYFINKELRYANFFLCPKIDDLYLKHLELVKLKAENILAILVTMTNSVKNYIVKMDKDVDEVDLGKVAQYINSKYHDHKISEISARLKKDLTETEDLYSQNIMSGARKVMSGIIKRDLEDDVEFGGLDCLASIPEFNDPAKTCKVIKIVTERKPIREILRKELPYAGIRSYIGSENENEELRECSIVTSGYSISGHTVGRIGIVGPTRMDYYAVFNALGCLSEIISEKLEDILG